MEPSSVETSITTTAWVLRIQRPWTPLPEVRPKERFFWLSNRPRGEGAQAISGTRRNQPEFTAPLFCVLHCPHLTCWFSRWLRVSPYNRSEERRVGKEWR